MWCKNVENAERDLNSFDAEEQRRLGRLAGREPVGAQTELRTASWVAISGETAQDEAALG